MQELTDIEKQAVALSLFKDAVTRGETAFNIIGRAVDKLGIRKEFDGYLKDWEQFKKSRSSATNN